MTNPSVYSDQAMLANLTIAVWLGKKRDKDVTEEVAVRHNAKGRAGTYTKNLIDSAFLQKVKKLEGTARNLHRMWTLPWLDNGDRILPTALAEDYLKKMREARRDYEAAVDDFIEQYNQEVAKAKLRLGTMYKSDDYPDKAVLREKFAFEFTLFPFPNTKDWRVSLAGKASKAVKEETERRIKATVEAAIRDLWQRLYETVEKMYETLSKTDAIFRDSLVSNLVEIVDLIPKLNIVDDPELNRISDEVKKKLCSKTPEYLRGDPHTRKKATKEAADILKKMKGYLG
jgi:hypothetical protein